MTQRKLGLSERIFFYSTLTLSGIVYGSLSSWLNPFFLPQGIREVRDNGLKGRNGDENLGLYTFAYLATGSYLDGVSNILEDLLKEPTNPVNYIPLVFNLVSGVGQVYPRICSRGKQEQL